MRTNIEDPQYHAKKPKWKLPILEAHYENGEHLIMTQSLSMLEFLEETYPGEIRLIPPVSEMAARAKVRDLALLVASDRQPLLSQRSLWPLSHHISNTKIRIIPYSSERTVDTVAKE